MASYALPLQSVATALTALGPAYSSNAETVSIAADDRLVRMTPDNRTLAIAPPDDSVSLANSSENICRGVSVRKAIVVPSKVIESDKTDPTRHTMSGTIPYVG